MLKKISLSVFILFLLAQFLNPEKNESTKILDTDFITTEKPPRQLANVLQNSCYDCHSNNTNYPWYDRITPVNFWVNGHIKHAKGELNFSEWNTYSAKKKTHKLEEFIEVLEDNKMPLSSYTLMHSEAKLTKDQTKALIDWITVIKIKYEITDLPI